MTDILIAKTKLLDLVKQLNSKYELSKTVTEDFFEPGMMENLEQYKGEYDEISNIIILRIDAKGLGYENRTINLEKISVGNAVKLIREQNNSFNSNNFMINSLNNESLGNLPAELCNVLAPLYDLGYASIISSTVSYLEKIRERSRYARQGVMFLEIQIRLRGI